MAEKPNCSIDGCDTRVHTRGWCNIHYQLWRRWGNPLGLRPPRLDRGCSVGGCERRHYAFGLCNLHRTRQRRFGSFDLPAPAPDYEVMPDGCWLWRKALAGGTGYGQLRRDNKTLLAHRVMYEQLVGPIPEGLVLDHLCRHRACVNPAHLEPVTFAENLRRGANVKLTHALVAEIRSLKGQSHRAIAAKYGVSSSHISRILSGHAWNTRPNGRVQ